MSANQGPANQAPAPAPQADRVVMIGDDTFHLFLSDEVVPAVPTVPHDLAALPTTPLADLPVNALAAMPTTLLPIEARPTEMLATYYGTPLSAFEELAVRWYNGWLTNAELDDILEHNYQSALEAAMRVVEERARDRQANIVSGRLALLAADIGALPSLSVVPGPEEESYVAAFQVAVEAAMRNPVIMRQEFDLLQHEVAEAARLPMGNTAPRSSRAPLTAERVALTKFMETEGWQQALGLV